MPPDKQPDKPDSVDEWMRAVVANAERVEGRLQAAEKSVDRLAEEVRKNTEVAARFAKIEEVRDRREANVEKAVKEEARRIEEETRRAEATSASRLQALQEIMRIPAVQAFVASVAMFVMNMLGLLGMYRSMGGTFGSVTP